MKSIRLFLLILTAALLSTAAWADGIDPKVIIQKGGGSTPITITDPNPALSGTPTQNSSCLAPTDACFSQVYQNQTGKTLTSLTIALNDISGFSFFCGDANLISFFSNCSSNDNGSVTDIFFSGGSGVGPATLQCVTPDSLGDAAAAFLLGSKWCTNSEFLKLDKDSDDYKYVGGEFAVFIDGTADFAGHSVTGETITTPEPGAGLMVLLGALAFGLIKVVRRAA